MMAAGNSDPMKVGRVRGYQEVSVFENQRYRPLFGWGSKGFLFPHDRSPFSDETGQTTFSSANTLNDIPPPPNCEWATPWKFNQDYTTVDGEGWCYARSFSRLSEKLEAGTSSSTPRPGHVVRRRLWTRYARRLRSSFPSPDFNLDQMQGSVESHPLGLFPFHLRESKKEDPKTTLEEVEVIIAVLYENERLGPHPSLPGQESWSVLHLSDTKSDWPPFSDSTGKHELPRPGAVKVKWGYHWADNWRCETLRNVTDLEGWIYSSSFSELGRLLTSSSTAQTTGCCRTRKWHRTMMRGHPLMDSPGPLVTPFELSITVMEVGGLSGSLNGVVKVEVAVEDAIAGLTSGRSTHPSAPGTLSGATSLIQSSDVTASTRLLWTNHNQFSIPLTSLENHNISFTLYCETDRAAPGVIGRAKTDSALGTLLWSQVNRKFDMGLPVTLESQVDANLSRYSTPYIVVQLQLQERSLFHLSTHPDIPNASLLSLPAPLSPVSQAQTNQGQQLHPMEYLIDELAFALHESSLFSTEARELATYAVSKANLFLENRVNRIPLLLLSLAHRQDICADYRTFMELRSLEDIDNGGSSIYPVPINGPMEDCTSGERALATPLPLCKQILRFFNLYSLQSQSPTLLLGRKGTRELHHFSFPQPSSLIDFLKAVHAVKSSDLHSSDEFTVRYVNHGASESVPCLLWFEMVEDQQSICWRSTQDPSSSVSLSLPVDEIEKLLPSVCPPLPFPIAIDLNIANLLNDDIRSGGVALLSIMTPAGQSETVVFSCDSNLRQSGKLRIFCGFEDLANGSATIGLHIQENPTKEIQTLGEVVVRLSTLTPLRRDTDPPCFHSQVPNFVQLQLQSPRYALMISFVHAFELLPMNLDKTSDPYCIVRLVDANNRPVARSSISGFRTKHVLKTLNPVWNQQLVFHSDSGFLRAVYIHIEVWDRDVITVDTCMGEVFLPLALVSSTQSRLSLALGWSPLMPTDYRRKSSNFGTIVLDVRTVPPAERDEFQVSRFSRYFTPACQQGVLEVTASASRVSAASANWIAQPVERINPNGTSFPAQGLFECCLRRNLPGLILLPASLTSLSEEKSSSRVGAMNETEVSSEKPSHSLFGFRKKKKSKSIHGAAPLSETSVDSASVSSFLEHCLESSPIGFVCIPWSQVLDVAAITASTTLITCAIHRRFVSGGAISHRKITVEIVIGPCPADSVAQQIKDCIELFAIQERLSRVFGSPPLAGDPRELRSILKDLSQLLTLTRLDCKRLLLRDSTAPPPSFPLDSRIGGDFYDLTLAIDSSADVTSLADSWAAIISHQAHILLLVARLICFSSMHLPQPLPSCAEEIHQCVEQRCEEAGFPLSSLPSDQPQRSGGASDLSQVLALIELSEDIVLELILHNWKKLLPDTTSWHNCRSNLRSLLPLETKVSANLFDALCDELVNDCHSLPKFSWMLAAALNSLYNRTISLIGRSVDRRQFEKLEGNQSRLDLIAFVITENDRVSASLDEILSLIGLKVTPSPLLSLALNIEGLLDRFASVLLVELRKYLSQALLSCRPASEIPIAQGLSLPWEVRTIEKTILVGPLPELIFEIFQTFLGMATPPDSYPDSSVVSRLRLLNMNKVIIHSVLISYDVLREELGRIFEGLTNMFDFLKTSPTLSPALGERLGEDSQQQPSQRVQEERQSQLILQNMSLLCSIANDCDRISTVHIPKLWKHAVVALTVDEGSAGEVWSKSQTFLQHLNGHVSDLQLDIKKIAWTAAELLTRIIFTDMRDLYLLRFEEILDPPTDRFPIFSSILRTLEDYLTDLKASLLPEYFRMLVLSCCHKILHRYFQKLYDYSRGISRGGGGGLVGLGPGIAFPVLSGAVKLGSLLRSSLTDKKLWRPPTALDQAQCLTLRQNVVEIVKVFSRLLDPSFHSTVLCNQLQQFNVFLDALEYSPSQSEFQIALRQIQELCGGREEAVLAVAVLKGIDPLALKGSQEPSSSAPLATDWNNAALIFTFCEDEIRPSDRSKVESAEFPLLSKLKGDSGERRPLPLLSPAPSFSASLGPLMGLEGADLRGLNQLQMVSEYFSPSGAASEGRERFTLTISQLQCRGIVASHHFRLGRSLVFVRVIHLMQQQQTKAVPSNLSPSWEDSISVTSQMTDLQTNGLLLEVMEHNWLIKRSLEIGSCRIDVPRITAQSPPLDQWIRLEKRARSRTRSGDHLFPVAAGVKSAAEAVAGAALKLDPFLSSPTDDVTAADALAEPTPSLELMIHVHIDFAHLSPSSPT